VQRSACQTGGSIFLYQHCITCGRDFVKRIDAAEWSAAHVGIFSFNLLDEFISRRWLCEKCPGKALAAELNDVRRLELITPTAVPIERFYCWTVPPGYPVRKMDEHLELMATKVIPHFR
jgi:hypothetical protein